MRRPLIRLLMGIATLTASATVLAAPQPLDTMVHGLLPIGLALVAGLAIWMLAWRLAINSRRLVMAQQAVEAHARELERQRAHLLTLVQTLPDLVWLKDPEGVYLACNPRFEQFFGVPAADIVGKRDRDFLSEDQARFFRDQDQRAMTMGGPSLNEGWVRFANDGHQELLETSMTPMYDPQGRLIGVLGIGRDITDRTRERDRLRQERDLFASGPCVVFQWLPGEEWRVGYASSNLLDVFGHRPEDLVSGQSPFTDLIHPDDRARVVREAEAHLAAGLNRYKQTYRLRHADGGWRWVDDYTSLVRDAEGLVTGIQGYLMDMTDTYGLEEAVRQRDRYQRAVLDNFPFMVWLKDADSRLLAVNQPYAAACGLDSPDGLVGKTDLDIWPMELAERYRAEDRQVLASGKPRHLEEPFESHGRRLWIETYKSPVTLDGQVVGTVGYARDISERKEAEVLLQAQHDFAGLLTDNPDRDTLLAAMLDTALKLPGLDGGGLYWREPDGGYRLVRHRGMSADFVTRMEWVTRDSNQGRLIRAGQRVCSCREPAPQCTDTDLIWQEHLIREGVLALVVLPILVRGEPVACLNLASRDQEQVTNHTVTALETLTRQFSRALERQQVDAEAELERRNFAALFDTLQDYLFVLDETGAIQHVNRAVRDGLGYGDRLLGQQVIGLHPEHAREEARRIVGDILTGTVQHCPLPLLKADGSEIMVDTQVTRGTWNGRPALFGISRDITEQMRITQALRESEENLRRAQAVSHTGSWHLDITSDVLTWSEETYRLFDVPSGQRLTLADFVGRIHPDDQDAVVKAWQGALTGSPYDVEHRVMSGGQTRWLRERAEFRLAADGTALEAMGTVQDITERRRAQDALEEAALFLRSTQAIARLGGWKSNLADDQAVWTEEIYHLLGLPPDQPPPGQEGRLRHFAPEYVDSVRQHLLRARESGTPFTLECEMLDTSGHRFWAELRCIGRVESDQGSYISGTLQDISVRKRAEDLERYGAFQAGVAEMSVSVLHNIGNAVTALLSDAEAVRKAGEDLARIVDLLRRHEAALSQRAGPAGLDAETAASLLTVQRQAASAIETLGRRELGERSQRIHDGVQHIAEIVRIQQNAALPASLDAAFDLAPVVRDAQALLGDLLERHGIQVETDIGPGLGNLALSRNRLLQALVNVFKNAMEAILERLRLDPRGTLGQISLRAWVLDSRHFRVMVMDNGIGLSREHQERVFHFGYSTKSRGSGFGLHATALFARELGGSVELLSDGPGRGATLVMDLPLHQPGGRRPAHATNNDQEGQWP